MYKTHAFSSTKPKSRPKNENTSSSISRAARALRRSARRSFRGGTTSDEPPELVSVSSSILCDKRPPSSSKSARSSKSFSPLAFSSPPPSSAAASRSSASTRVFRRSRDSDIPVFLSGLTSSSRTSSSRTPKSAWNVRAASSESRGERPGVESGSSFAAASHRSGRALEWSGPWPSWPCGSNNTMPLLCPHFASAVVMNWSTTHCALFAKSPNCASQSTKVSWPASTLYPYSNPNTACSLSGELAATKRSWRPNPRLSSGFTPRLVRLQYRTAWRWLNVPRSTS
mmetsp:Transcript_14999/g.63281  ORF Transcript_14999/g.63281 Transcript_14999/m.63281 type:complete len:284 (-) Transcript_14999:992-1843(-)